MARLDAESNSKDTKAKGSDHPDIDHLQGKGADKLADTRKEIYGSGGQLAATDKNGKDPVKGDGFEIVDTKEAQAEKSAPADKVDYKLMEKYADQFEQACNGGLTGLTTDEDTVRNILMKVNKDEYKVLDDIFARKYGVKYAEKGKRWGIKEELKDELDADELKQAERIIDSKFKNEVPEQFRVSGKSLLKPGSELKVGELNQVNLPDGRSYSVYIPRNADSRSPVIVAVGGAAMGDNKGTMENESGLMIDSEVQGSIMVFATPKVRKYETYGKASVLTLGSTDGVAWNVPGKGRTDLPKAESESYNDEDYIDAIKKDLDGKVKTSDKIGMFGFSDGGRFAEVYAADRPEKIAAVAVMEGTWMEGDRPPKSKMPIMIIHGDHDETLKYEGGPGSTGEMMENALHTNLDKSRPYMQKQIWSKANGCEADPKVVDGKKVKITTYGGCDDAPVFEEIVKGAGHALHDADNNGDRFFQWLLGEPDRSQDLATTSARFLKGFIVKDS